MVNKSDIMYYIRINYSTNVFGVYKRKSELRWNLIFSNESKSFSGYFDVEFEKLFYGVKLNKDLLLTQKEYDKWLISQI
jgi:hypothetical protein